MLVVLGGSLAASPVSTWSMRAWKSEDGLPNNGVSGVAQATNGYLWVATESGVARFDGFRFEDFSRELNQFTHNQAITALITAHDDSLWLATERGRIINLNSQGAHVFTNGLSDQLPERMTEDGQGAIWISYRDGSVVRLDRGVATSIKIPDEMPAGRFTSFTTDNNGQLWYAKGGEVGVYRDGKFTTVVEMKDITATVMHARSGGVWICVRNELYKFGEDQKLQDFGSLGLDVSYSSAASPIVLLEDRDSNLWIGISPGGLMCYNGQRLEHIPTSARYVTSLLQDREGNIWAGTGGGGLDRVQRRVVAVEGNAATGAPFERADSVCQDDNGGIWVAARGGVLARKVGDTWEDMMRRSWPGGGALCVTVDRAGVVWIGTSAKKYVRWQGGSFSPSARPDVKGQVIHAVLAKRNGDVYFGEERPDVVQRFHNGQLTTLALPADAGIVRALIEDAAGNVWIGTEKGGLWLAIGDNVTEIAPQTDDAFFAIRALYPAEDGSVWIGYGGAGIGRLKDGRITRINTANGLPDNYISQLVEDEHGWFWVGSDRGLFRVQQRDLDAVADGREKQVRAVMHGQEEGSAAVQASFGFWPGALRTADGRIWMPTRNALAVVDPAQIHDDALPSPVLLTQVIVDDKPVAQNGAGVPVEGMMDLQQPATHLQLPPQHRRVEFNFTALSLQAPENVRFRYWLEGFDEPRSEPTAAHSVSYSRLPAGTYRFHVTGCNSSGIWNEAGATLSFTVRPFFWQTWWFRFTMLALSVATIVAIVRYVSFRRLRKQLRIMERQAAVDKERARIAQDLHDDLGATMTRMTLLLELASKNGGDPAATANNVREGLDTAREAIKSLDAAVWAVNPRNNTLPELVDYIGQFGMEFLQNAKIKCELDLPDQPPDRMVSGELRHNLFLVVKEALNNIVRHADATTVALSIQATDRFIAVQIKDDGRGFEHAPQNGLADGLRNMQQRMEEINGRFEIESRPGEGTRIAVQYHWPTENTDN